MTAGSQGPESGPGRDPWAHRRGEPRTFAMAWVCFLFAAAVLSLSLGGALGLVSTDVYRGSARVMLDVVGVGVGVLWPMLRLSQERPVEVPRAMVQDALVVFGTLQVIALPQMLPWMGAWPPEPVLALGAGYTAWTLLVSGVLGLWWGRPRVPGWIVMVGLVGLECVGPVVTLLSGEWSRGPDRAWWGSAALGASPLTMAREVLADRTYLGAAAAVDGTHWATVGAVGLLGGALWAASWRRH